MSHGRSLAYRAALAAAALTLLAGAAACLAWIAGVPEVTRLVPASSTVHFNTGVLFALAGGGLIAGLRRQPLAEVAGAVLTVLIATVTLAQYLWGLDFGIDQFLMKDTAGAATYGRMAPNTAVTFVLAGLAMLFLVTSARLAWTAGIAQMLGALVFALGGVALVGYAVDLEGAFQWAGLTRMALYTAAAFVVLGATLMLAATHASGATAWHEMPWLAVTTGVGVAGLSALGWQALRSSADATHSDLADVALAFGLLTAVLLAGAVAQARHLHQQARQLASANAALQASEGRLQLLLDGLQAAVVVHGPDSGIRYANRAAAAILGLTSDQLLGKTAVDPDWHFLREDGSVMPVAEYPVSLVFARKAPLHDYLVGVRSAPDRNARWVQVNAVPDLDADGQVRLVIVSFVDISERQHQTQQLERIVLTDALTGLATRRHFLAQAEHEISRARRGHPLSLLLMDVDHFKSINDTHGHAAGDRALVELAELMRRVLRDVDLAGRLGGEEFGVLLPDTDLGSAEAVAERLRAETSAAAVPLEGRDGLRFTVSIGVVALGPADATFAMLLARADEALYEAKRSGRNCVRTSRRPTA